MAGLSVCASSDKVLLDGCKRADITLTDGYVLEVLKEIKTPESFCTYTLDVDSKYAETVTQWSVEFTV